jgi:hypothetical protein
LSAGAAKAEENGVRARLAEEAGEAKDVLYRVWEEDDLWRGAIAGVHGG